MYDRLKEAAELNKKSLDISERTVRNLVAKIRQEIDSDDEVFLPLLHPAGEAQVDFGTTVFYKMKLNTPANIWLFPFHIQMPALSSSSRARICYVFCKVCWTYLR